MFKVTDVHHRRSPLIQGGLNAESVDGEYEDFTVQILL